MNAPLFQFEIHDASGVVLARQHARTIAGRLGFPPISEAEIIMAVTSVAYDAVKHVGGASLEFHLEGSPLRSLVIQMVDCTSTDPTAADIRDFEAPRRLMDTFEVDASSGFTTISMAKALPSRDSPANTPDLGQIAGELAVTGAPSPIDELLRQDRELLQARRDLKEADRGILALHGELAEREASLKRAGELKTRFLANVSHQLRTPLSSILGLARLLLDRADGELSVEQDRQASFILRAAHELTGLVNDLIELARVEADREDVRPSEIRLPEFFDKLRGMVRPLQPAGSPVSLVFEDPVGLPAIWTDEGKLAQVLRNFLTNALKFTESGEIRVKAESITGDSMVISVQDTGLGIAPEHLEHVFEEFGQIDSPLQRLTTGTGLGLPLARKVAAVLGGRVEVLSRPGQGSTFTLTIPIRFSKPARETEDCPEIGSF